MLDHRHLSIFADPLYQALATSRHDNVHVLGHGDQFADCIPVRGFDDLHCSLRQPRFQQPFANAGSDRLIGMQSFGTTAQDGGVA